MKGTENSARRSEREGAVQYEMEIKIAQKKLVLSMGLG
jgi:hypothetical protein